MKINRMSFDQVKKSGEFDSAEEKEGVFSIK